MASERAHPQHPEQRTEGPTISVMDWLVSVGEVVARKLRGVPASPMAPLHPRS